MTAAPGACKPRPTATIAPLRTCTSPPLMSPKTGSIVITYARRMRNSVRGGKGPTAGDRIPVCAKAGAADAAMVPSPAMPIVPIARRRLISLFMIPVFAIAGGTPVAGVAKRTTMSARPEVRPFHTAAAAFAAGTDSPRDLLERCIGIIDATERDVQAFEYLDLTGARKRADESGARYRAGTPRSSIDGIPFGIKDIIETADMPTGMGSPLFSGFRSGRDAASVAALREAGAVIVGKTVTTEFAATVPGKTHNPWDLARTPGGSSSGSAAAVGSGMLCAALGTQVIGSILRPASYCGCVGYKPSVGGINRGGSLDFHSQSTHGVLAATLEDAWHVAREITARAGGDPGYPGIRGPLTVPPARAPKTLAFLETPGWQLATADAKNKLQSTLAALRAAGISIVDRHTSAAVADVEAALPESRPLSTQLNTWEFRWPLNTFARDMDHAKLSGVMQQRLLDAEAMTLEDYQVALVRRDEIRALYARLAASCDAAVSLSAPGPAPLGLASTGEPAFVVPGSLLGVPALSLPLLETESLPLGLQLLGFLDRDADLFALAAGVRTILS
jgi:Asp-tRNA(Asn)/Glu-tRNA(Gln) amidotransferase A subunit family amidase